MTGGTVELLPHALEEGMGTEKASGLCGVRPRTAYGLGCRRMLCSHASPPCLWDTRISGGVGTREKGLHMAGMDGPTTSSRGRPGRISRSRWRVAGLVQLGEV